jgi:type III pantothenate kinase
MILELDCGNSRVKWRMRNESGIQRKGFFLTARIFEPDEFKRIPQGTIKRVLVSSVLDEEYSGRVIAWTLRYFDVIPEFAISELSGKGVINGYLLPEKLGVDRWLGMVAARCKTSRGFVLVDCGSAITVDLVTSKGVHLGGYIAPGLKLMLDALTIKTAKITIDHLEYPDNVFPGRNTVDAIKSAELIMIVGLVNQAVAILQKHEASGVVQIITGGDGEWLSSRLENSLFFEDLVLDGLSIALEPLRP